MSVLNELNLTQVVASSNEQLIREILSKLFWTWYDQNTDRKLTTIKWFFISKTIYVRDLIGVFELLFGQRNGNTA